MSQQIITPAVKTETRAKTSKPTVAKLGSNSEKVLTGIIKSIKARDEGYYVETGRDLIRAKEVLGHGQFGPWLKKHLDYTPAHANNFMNAAKLIAKDQKFLHLSPSAVMALGGPSVPDFVTAEVLAEIDAGKRPTVAEIKAKIKAAKPPKAAAEGHAGDEAEADDAPAVATPPAGKHSYDDLVALLKKFGEDVAFKAIEDAFKPKEAIPAVVAPLVPVQPVVPLVSLADEDISEEELEELDLSQAA